MKEIYIDCTTIVFSPDNTGIQRVEKNIIKNIFNIAKANNIIVHLVFFVDSDTCIEINDIEITDHFNICNLYMVRKSLIFFNIRSLIRIAIPSKKIKSFFQKHWYGWKKFGLFIPSLFFVFPVAIYAIIYTFFNSSKDVIEINKNGILLIIGVSWLSDSTIKLLNKIKNNNATIITLIYDVIPLLYPDFCNKEYCSMFSKNFSKISNLSDNLITISKSEKNNILNIGNNKKPQKISHFRLGCELPIIKNTNRIERLNIFSNEKSPYISVGTVEPRKNHTFLLDAFDKLWNTGSDVKLCIIGKQGWLVDDLVKRINQHNQYGKSLFWFQDLTDDELIFCYKNARGLIFSSFIEGFGLPLVEALHYQCPVMASDIPVFHEIGGEYCSYFSLNDINQLVNLIDKFEESGRLPGVTKDIKDFHWPNWKESTEEFWDVLEKYIN